VNGLALCSIHHKALDYGAIGVSEEHAILVSCDVHGSSVKDWFEPFHGKKLRLPPWTEWVPNLRYIRWHSTEVFRLPARASQSRRVLE
jgi:putative restriction endonuclease